MDPDVIRTHYDLPGGWVVTIEQDFRFPTTGPTRLVIEPNQAWPDIDTDTGEPDFGPYDSDGIQQAHLRAVPLRQARKDLDAQRLDRIGASIASRMPADFAAEGDVALARLAYVYVELWGRGVRSPVSVIAKACEPHVQGTWAARVRRAREKNFLIGTERGADAQPSLGASAVALLSGSL